MSAPSSSHAVPFLNLLLLKIIDFKLVTNQYEFVDSVRLVILMDVLHLGRRDPRDAGQRNPERDQVDKKI